MTVMSKFEDLPTNLNLTNTSPEDDSYGPGNIVVFENRLTDAVCISNYYSRYVEK